MDRRRFLHAVTGLAAAGALSRCSSVPRPPPERQRIVLVRFGGGVRHQDLFGDRKRCLAPHLRHLAESGAFYPELWNDHLTRHDAANLYLLTGQYGARLGSNAEGPKNVEELSAVPTLFERYRKAWNRPLSKVLAAGVPDCSNAEEFGEPYRAMTFAPEGASDSPSFSGDESLGPCAHRILGNERLLRIVGSIPPGTVPKSEDARRGFLLAATRSDLESHPLAIGELTPAVAEALTGRLLAGRPFIAADEADDWLTSLTLEALVRLRPELVMIAFSTPDLAHRGAWRSYEAAVRQVDLQLSRLTRFLSTNPYYRSRTTLLITTDCGRGAEQFDEHMVPFDDPSHRHLFLLATGVGQRSPIVIEERRQQVDVAASIATMLEFDLDGAADGVPLLEVVS
ncbi:MAG: hypothetical protein V2A76_12550 [Planctomycetota bacterium]